MWLDSARNVPPATGFTLVELVVVLSIVAILFTVGVPSFGGLIQDVRLSSSTNDFFAAINLARTEAVQRGTRVDMMPAGDRGDWADGWVVFVDHNLNRRPDGGETIFIHGPAARGMRITADLSDSTVQYLAYSGAGRTRTHASVYRAQFGTFTFELGAKVRKIKLNFVGRPRICNPEVDPRTC